MVAIDMDESDKEIRKIRKKLRQIHNLLTATRDLNEQEEEKVDQYEALQARLDQLLTEKSSIVASIEPAAASATYATTADVTEDEDEEVEDLENVEDDKRDSLDAVIQKEEMELRKFDDAEKVDEEIACPTPIKVARKEVEVASKKSSGDSEPNISSRLIDRKEKTVSEQRKKACDPEKMPENRSKKQWQPQPTKDEAVKKPIQWWRQKPKYFVQELVGHSDIVLDVSIADGLVVSASRDTLLKVWSTDTGLLECTLSGHVEAVNACICLPLDVTNSLMTSLSLSATTRLVISGGLDSYILLWRVDTSLKSSHELKRIYVFTPVTCLAMLSREGTLAAAVGTSSGKIELWDILSKSQTGCQASYRSSVSSVRVLPSDNNSSGRLISCSEDGEIAIHLIDSLAPIFKFGDASPQPARSPRQPISDASSILPLGSAADWLLVGDGGSSLKLLQRGFKGIKKVANSKSEFGACDGLWCMEDGGCRIVFSTSLDIDTGRGSLNVFNLTNPTQSVYLLSLQPKQFSGRFLCLDGEQGKTGGFPNVLVTGGVELLLWQKVTSENEYSAAEVAIGRTISLHRRPDDEWSHGESEISSDEWSEHEEEDDDAVESPSRWWCHVL